MFDADGKLKSLTINDFELNEYSEENFIDDIEQYIAKKTEALKEINAKIKEIEKLINSYNKINIKGIKQVYIKEYNGYTFNII